VKKLATFIGRTKLTAVATVGVPWRFFVSLEFWTTFQTAISFYCWRYPNFLTTQRRTSGQIPAHTSLHTAVNTVPHILDFRTTVVKTSLCSATTYADNAALPTFACRTPRCCAPCSNQSISLAGRAHRQTGRRDGRTDGQCTIHRPFPAYYAGSANNRFSKKFQFN